MITADTLAAQRWHTNMLTGNFSAAWQESDEIRLRNHPDPHRFWLGEDVRGKRVMLRSLHGYGDAVQFLRYAPRLRALAADLIVEVPPAMLEIGPCFNGVEHVITWGAEEPYPWDVQVEITELPYLFRTDLCELPIATNYLQLPKEAIRHAAVVMGAPRAPRVGLVWAAGAWNPTRSLPLALLRPILDGSACEYWSLQGGEAAQHILPGLRDAAMCGDGILPLASAISHLDLVITVDTLAAHLAGALGKPVWVLLAHEADWRWMTSRSDSPWYPSMKLFRQPSPGDWPSVVNTAQLALELWLEQESCVDPSLHSGFPHSKSNTGGRAADQVKVGDTLRLDNSRHSHSARIGGCPITRFCDVGNPERGEGSTHAPREIIRAAAADNVEA